MTTVPSSLAGRGAIAGLIATLCVAMGASLSAHRRDELLQAARVGVEPDRVRLEISLTPGIEIAEAFIREIDDDGDLRLSEAEQQAYAERVLGRVALRVDDSVALRLLLAGARFPSAVALRSGEAAITLEMEAALPSLSPGAHRLFFRNDSAGGRQRLSGQRSRARERSRRGDGAGAGFPSAPADGGVRAARRRTFEFQLGVARLRLRASAGVARTLKWLAHWV